MEVALADAGPHVYQLLTGSICPRPIAWVSTIDLQGRANLAPFSFFTVASVDPVVLAFAPQTAAGGHDKDTIVNLRQVPECVINICDEALAAAMNQTAATLEPGEDEFAFAGLEKAPLQGVDVPRVKQAPFAYGCTLHDIVSFGDHPGAGQLVLAQVVSLFAEDGLWDGHHVDMAAFAAIGRTVGGGYVRATDRFEMQRPK